MAAEKNDLYLVLKTEDIDELSSEEKDLLHTIIGSIYNNRMKKNKRPFNRYYVVNQDEPYAGDILKVILAGEYEKEKADKE